jgi:aminopeptidase
VRDERIARYADLLVGTCIDVQPGWEVIVAGTPLGKPLLQEIGKAIARRGARAIFQVSFSSTFAASDLEWVKEAPRELLEKPSALQAHLLENCDALMVVDAPENTRDAVTVDPDRLAATRAAYRPSLQRYLAHEVPWVGCQFPTPALAQEAGMGTEEFADFLYGACLLDWKAEGERMQRYADRFDAADEVRIVGDRTDITLSISGRKMEVDAGGANMPGGEFFGCPIEDSAEGEIVFAEFPAVILGRELNGVRLKFEAGKVVDASADTHEDFLLETLDSDEGVRRLGELGVGCNPGITRYMKNTLFDEKIDCTVHLALGNGFPNLGGTNESNLHWDIVKDLRNGGRIYLDGELVQEDGRWLV